MSDDVWHWMPMSGYWEGCEMSVVHGLALLIGCLYGMVCEVLGLNISD